MTEEQKNKVFTSLLFHESDLWDSIMLIINDVEKHELTLAVSQSQEESKRAHQCGRADGIQYVKDLLNDTRQEALIKHNRKNVDKR
jgi:hypothetical protein